MKTSLSKIFAFFLLSAMLLSLCACSASTAPAEEQADTQTSDKIETVKIGLITIDLGNEFFARVAEGAQTIEKQTNGHVKITVVDGKSSPDVQAQAFDNFVAAGVDIVMGAMLDPDAIKASARDALSQGILVACYPAIEGCTSGLTWDMYTCGHDLGVDAGKYIAENLGGKATVACLGQLETEDMNIRMDAYKEGILEYCDSQNITFLEPVNAATVDAGASAISSLIQANPDINVILAAAESGSVGAYEELKAQGLLTDKMYIGGCDGGDQAMACLKEGGAYRGSSAVALDTADMWGGFIQNAIRAKLGLSYVFNYPAPTTLITQANVEEFTQQGVQKILDEGIAAYWDITEVPVGSIGVNHYEPTGEPEVYVSSLYD